MQYKHAEFLIRDRLSIFILVFGMVIMSTGIYGQQLEIEWDGSERDLIQLIEGGNLKFSIEGHTSGTPDRVTFKIRSGDTLISALTIFEGGTVRLKKVDTIIMNATNVVRKADGTLGVRQYRIGDFAHGGIVFWIDETGEHGLVVDTADLSVGIPWSNGVFKVTNATGNGVRSGEMNTALIIAQQTIDSTAGNFAALLCANLIRGSFGDWYLPSIEELNLIYKDRDIISASAMSNGGSALTNQIYWSSTETNDSFVQVISFDVGFFADVVKSSSYHVRAIRAF